MHGDTMNVAARAALGAGSLAISGFGAKAFVDFAGGRMKAEHAELQDATRSARTQWESWKGKLDAEFPGGALETPQDHARLERFLQQHPAPPFVTVEHAEFTRIRTSTDGLPVPRDLLPVEFQKSNGYPAAFGAMGVLGGGAMLVNGIARGGATTRSAIGVVAGGAALAALSGAMLLTGINGFRIGPGTEGAEQLRDEIDAPR